VGLGVGPAVHQQAGGLALARVAEMDLHTIGRGGLRKRLDGTGRIHYQESRENTYENKTGLSYNELWGLRISFRLK
jgi:hypothetical protein